MASEKILKKSIFGGFSKESVFSYIEKLQNDGIALKEEFEEFKAEAKRSAEEKDCEIEALKSKNASLLESNAEYSLRAEEANANIEAYEAKLSRCTQMIEDIGAKFEELQSKYDHYGDAGALIAQAQASADEINGEARKALCDAAEKISAANDRMRNACTEFGSSTDTVRNGAEELLKVISELSERFSESGEQA